MKEVTTKAVSDTPIIGATMDMTSRAGKEARVAMEIAINDFNTKTHKNITLYTKDSKGKVVQAIQNAISLIETHKVEVILGLQTMEEVLAVGEISNEAQIQAFSLLDSVPQWALDRFPFLVQASPSQFAQMKAFVAIMESYGWNRFTFIYEDINLASIQVIPYLMETIKESGVHMSSIINLSPLTSSALLEELERINSEQSRVFLVHASLETSIHLFQNAKIMGMMESGYVWITTNLITDLLYTVNSSTFLTMEGVVGLGSFFPETGSQFHDFSTKFQSKFKIQHPEEENNMPGIFAVQAYDATWIAALTMSLSTQPFLEAISSISFAGITGEVQIVNQKSTASHRFQIVNVVGKYYSQLGFWSEGLGFSKVIDDKATYETLMQILGPIIWPGRPLNTPRGWGDPTGINHLRVGVPTMAMFKKFVEVKYNDTNHNVTYTGYSIELFNETMKRLRYNMSYEFIPFNGTYDSLVEQVYLKKVDVVVGDVSVVSWRYKYADFTYPYTETGLVMIVPLTSYHDPWLFVKPFTLSMWALTIILNIYCGFVVWLIERKNSPELQGSPLNQAGIVFSLAFTRMFYTNVDDVSSNLTRMTIMAWFFAAIIIGQCYTASLTSMLTVRKLIPQVTDYETLKNSNAIVGYDQGSQVASYLVDVLGFKSQNIKGFTSPEEYANALGKKEIAAIFLVAPYAKLFLTKYCKRFITAGNTFGEAGFGFAFPKGSPMVSDFTKALLNMSESGALRDFEKRILGSERCVDQEGNQDDNGGLDIGSFWSLFLLAGGISTLALVIYSTILAFGLYLFLLSLLEVTTKAVSDTPNIGATMDMTSRAGKEARVAMEIAINDFNTKTHKNITLYPKDSKGKVVQAIQNAINLIETHKVDVILGLQTMEEVLAVGEISNEAQIPAFSLLDAVPQWALDRFPFLVQASPSQFAQMKAFVAIMESYGWNRFTFIYEDINLASIQVIPYLMETIKESGVHMSSIINLSPLTSSTLLEELERINSEQSRVFLVHASLETSIHLFQNAKSMGMMESGYVWITTNLITDLLYTVNSSTFLTMEGVVGLGSFFPETGSQFHDFSTKFQSKFKIQHPEEENNMPGIFAVQAYDATWIAALTMSLSTQTFLEAVSSISFAGIAGEVQIVNQKSTASHRFQIVNVIGKYYRQLGFWSEGLGFSKVIDDKATYETLMHILGPIIWPGRPLNTPRGWGDPTSINHLRVGVPTMAMFKKFVEVKYNDTSHSFTYTGYSIELFNETIKRLRYNMSYEFIPFTGTYDSLVEQVYLKKFDVVVGDVSVVSWRYKYVDFTYPYTETGLVMIVPLTSHHDSWLFVKPFTLSMWALTIILNIYCGFVVWLIERKNSPELQGSPLNQAGILFSLAFTRMFYTNVDDVSSNLTRMTIMAWFFAAIIIGQCYTASLTSMLTVRKLIPQVTDYETLKKSNAIVGYDQGSQVASYLVDVLGFKRQNIRPFTSPEEYAHALGKKEIAAVFLVAPYAKLFLTKYCKMSITAGNTFGEAGFGFAFPKGSPMVSDFTKALLNMSESGALRDFKKRMLGSERCEDLEGNQDDYDRLGIDSFWSLFLLAGGISTLALVIYVIKNHCLFKSISEVRKCFVHQQKRLSRKVSDVEGQEGPNAVEIT
ncbi:hypothetical protein R6Q59_021510 [Mikania micrantha]